MKMPEPMKMEITIDDKARQLLERYLKIKEFDHGSKAIGQTITVSELVIEIDQRRDAARSEKKKCEAAGDWSEAAYYRGQANALVELRDFFSPGSD